jgi:hypothetical protein
MIRRTARRVRGRWAVMLVVYLALAWLFGGPVGLAIGLAAVAAWAAFRLRTRDLWIGSLAALAAAPVALIAQGLPKTLVVGPSFGESHLAAHVLVGISMALAAFAGLIELDRTWPPRLGPHRTAADREAPPVGTETVSRKPGVDLAPRPEPSEATSERRGNVPRGRGTRAPRDR